MNKTNPGKDNTDGTVFQDARIKRASEMTGLPYTALRYYEDMGLIHTKRDENSNYRVYSQITMAELSDVIIYRNLNLPIEDVKKVMTLPIEESETILNKAVEDTVRKINEMTSSLNELYHKKDRIARFYKLKADKERIVHHVEIGPLRRFSYNDKEDMRRYIQNPYSISFVIYLEDIRNTESLRLGLEEIENTQSECMIWEPPVGERDYYKCLLKTEYGKGEILGLDKAIHDIAAQGRETVSLLGKYIISDLENDVWYDYYETWIELK